MRPLSSLLVPQHKHKLMCCLQSVFLIVEFKKCLTKFPRELDKLRRFLRWFSVLLTLLIFNKVLYRFRLANLNMEDK